MRVCVSGTKELTSQIGDVKQAEFKKISSYCDNKRKALSYICEIFEYR